MTRARRSAGPVARSRPTFAERAAIRVPHLPEAWVARGVVAAATLFLLARLAADVGRKPLFEDEAIAGLIAARPLVEVVQTSLWERGGAPLHFVLAHVVFAFDASAGALRWLSIVFALATVVVSYDLARRLGGEVAGATAAIVAATSGLLAVYGSFGRMYSLFAFAGAVALDLFVRAVQRPSVGSATLAAAAAWLLPATHPYGGLVVAVEAGVALALWRGRRPLRSTLPVVAVALTMLPFAVGDLRLGDRFQVDVGRQEALASPGEAWRQLSLAVRGFAGGEGITLVLFGALALAGLLVLGERRSSVPVLVGVALVLPPLLSLAVATGSEASSSPRHLIFALPAWAAFIGVAAERLLAAVPPLLRATGLAALAGAAAVSPIAIPDPRALPSSAELTAELGSPDRLASSTAWLRGTVERGDVLFPYSAIFLAALPTTRDAVSLPRAQPQQVVRALEHVPYPARSLVVAVPSGKTRFAPRLVERHLGRGFQAHAFGPWLLLRAAGPFHDRAAVLKAGVHALAGARTGATTPIPAQLEGYLRLSRSVMCAALRSLGERCSASAAS